MLSRPDGAATSIDEIAVASGVSKRTIYRWWPSKGAVLLEAMVEQVYELLWYRILVGHAPLTADVAARLARTLTSEPRMELIVVRRGGSGVVTRKRNLEPGHHRPPLTEAINSAMGSAYSRSHRERGW